MADRLKTDTTCSFPMGTINGQPIFCDQPRGHYGDCSKLLQRIELPPTPPQPTSAAPTWECDEDCTRCSGEYCETHFDRPCDCDVLDRHHIPNSDRRKAAVPPAGEELLEAAAKALDREVEARRGSGKSHVAPTALRLARELREFAAKVHMRPLAANLPTDLVSEEQLVDWLKRVRAHCHNTYNGGHRDKAVYEAFHHGMDTVFNVMEDWLPKQLANHVPAIDEEEKLARLIGATLAMLNYFKDGRNPTEAVLNRVENALAAYDAHSQCHASGPKGGFNAAASTKLFMKLVAAAYGSGLSAWDAQEKVTIDALRALIGTPVSVEPEKRCAAHVKRATETAYPPSECIICLNDKDDEYQFFQPTCANWPSAESTTVSLGTAGSDMLEGAASPKQDGERRKGERRKHQVCRHTLEKGWPLDSGDWDAHTNCNQLCDDRRSGSDRRRRGE